MENQDQKTLRFAVMCTGTNFQRWQADAIRLLQRNHRLVLLIKDPRVPVKQSLWKKLYSYHWSQILFFFCYRFFFRFREKSIVDLSAEVQDIEMISCEVQKKGYSEYFKHEDIDLIKSFQLDFIIRFGFNIIRGEILKAAQYGVWSFHHDDETKYRGGPAGFWEIWFRDPLNGAILQQLTEKLDSGIILKKGWLKTISHSYSGNLDQLLNESAAWPTQVATSIAHGSSVNAEPSASKAPVYKVPGNMKMIFFLIRLFRNKVKFHMDELFRSEKWNVAVIDKPVHEALTDPSFNSGNALWMEEAPAGQYYADPFPFILNGKTHILFEHYHYHEHQAYISSVSIEKDKSFGTITKAISISGHLSYPSIFLHKDETYCIPESFHSHSVDLYRLDKENSRFEYMKTILSGIDAVDPTLLFYNGYFWLFFTLKTQSNASLHVWFSTELNGEYSPHFNNPVKTDIRASRPAGSFFIHNGELYRPAQDCSVTYGGQVVINKVVKLTPFEFEEEVVKTISPDKNFRYSKGLHTLSGISGVTVIDGKRYVFNSNAFREQLFSKIRRMKKNRE